MTDKKFTDEEIKKALNAIRYIREIRSDAIKMFAKRLREKAFISSVRNKELKVVSVFDITIIEKEMTEGQK